LANNIFKYFVPSKETSLAEQLAFQAPTTVFSTATFTVLNEVLEHLEMPIPRLGDIAQFLINDVLFNFVTYYDASVELTGLISKMLQLSPSLTGHLMNRVKESYEEMKSSKPNMETLTSRVRFRGLHNLGPRVT
jgi:hypothetical protein